MAKRPTYTREFRDEVVRLYKSSGKTARVIAEELGVSSFSVRKWAVDAAGRGDPAAVSVDEEVRRLRRENRILREGREVLRKAAAFFARENH